MKKMAISNFSILDIEKFNLKILQIERIIRITNTDSCFLIYFQLLIFGKSTPSELRKKTNQGKSSLYRNLSLLFDADLVGKETDQTVTDKRYQTYYYAKISLGEFSKVELREELLIFAKEKHKIGVINEYELLIQKMPIIFTQLCSTLFLNQDPITKVKILNRANSIDSNLLEECNVILFTLFDAEENPQIIKKFSKFLKSMDMKKIGRKQEGMRIPVALSINMMSFDRSNNKS